MLKLFIFYVFHSYSILDDFGGGLKEKRRPQLQGLTGEVAWQCHNLCQNALSRNVSPKRVIETKCLVSTRILYLNTKRYQESENQRESVAACCDCRHDKLLCSNASPGAKLLLVKQSSKIRSPNIKNNSCSTS